MLTKPKPLILPKRGLLLPPSTRRPLPRPAPWIWVPKRFAPMMAVAFDVKATVANDSTNTSPIQNNSVNLSASASLLIAIFTSACTSGGTLQTPSAPTWAGVTMTLIGNKTGSDSLSNIYAYGLVSPATGAGHTLSCTFSGGAGTVDCDLDYFSFTGTNTTSVANAVPAANVQTDASTTSGTVYPNSAFAITTVSGDMAVAAMNLQVATFATVGTGTLINTESSTNVNYTSARNAAVGSTTNIQFSGGAASSPCCGIAFDIAQPGGGDVLQAQSVM